MQDKKFIYKRAWQLFCSGVSIRTLSKHFKIPRATIQYVFKKEYGKDYSLHKNPNGVFPVIDEYLNSSLLTPEQKQQILEWKERRMTEIIEVDAQYKDIRLLTAKQEDTLTRQECTHKNSDWRDRFSELAFNRAKAV